MSFSSASVATPSATISVASLMIGSRLASSARSLAVLYSFSSSESECEIRADDLRVHERRTLAGAGVLDRGGHRLVGADEVGAVDALDEEARERRHQLGEIAAGRLHFDRGRDRVAVVLDQVDNRQPARAGGIQRFPEFPFARRPFADRDVGDFVALEVRLAPLDRRDLFVEPAGLRCADRVQALRAGWTRLRHDVELLVAPVRRHLASTGVGIVLGADGAEQHLERRHAQGEAQGAIAIVGMEPVVAGLQHHAGGGEHGFVPGAADLEEDQALVFELNLFVIQLP